MAKGKRRGFAGDSAPLTPPAAKYDRRRQTILAGMVVAVLVLVVAWLQRGNEDVPSQSGSSTSTQDGAGAKRTSGDGQLLPDPQGSTTGSSTVVTPVSLQQPEPAPSIVPPNPLPDCNWLGFELQAALRQATDRASSCFVDDSDTKCIPIIDFPLLNDSIREAVNRVGMVNEHMANDMRACFESRVVCVREILDGYKNENGEVLLGEFSWSEDPERQCHATLLIRLQQRDYESIAATLYHEWLHGRAIMCDGLHTRRQLSECAHVELYNATKLFLDDLNDALAKSGRARILEAQWSRNIGQLRDAITDCNNINLPGGQPTNKGR